MARPKKVIDVSTGKIGKEAIKNRQEQEKKLKLDRDQLSPPTWLSENAKKEFGRIVSEAEKISLLDNLDLGILAIYCNAYDCYVETACIIQEDGVIDLTTNGSKVINPNVTAQEKYVKQIMQCSSKLGLATTDRLKLIVPTKEEPKENKFLGKGPRYG